MTPELRLRAKREDRTAPPLTHDLAMQRARAALADLQHTRRDILTLRDDCDGRGEMSDPTFIPMMTWFSGRTSVVQDGIYIATKDFGVNIELHDAVGNRVAYTILSADLTDALIRALATARVELSKARP